MKQGSQIVWSTLLLGLVFSFGTASSFAASDTPAAPSPAVFDSADTPRDYVTGTNGKQYLNLSREEAKRLTKFRKVTKLTFPDTLRRTYPRGEWVCTVELLVNESGTVDDVHIVECPKGFHKAIKRIQKWTLHPIEQEGSAIPFVFPVPIRWRLS